MPEVLLLTARFVAIFGLVISIALIIARWRLPQPSSKAAGSGSSSGAAPKADAAPSFWQLAWFLYRRSRARDRANEADLRAIRKKSVLVVDPDEKSRKVLVWRLQQLGCQVMNARSGSQAVGLVKERAVTLRQAQDAAHSKRGSTLRRAESSGRSIDVVISDALLPDISAVDFCDELAGWDGPIVLLGVLPSQREELSMLGGRIGCLGKPYDPYDAAVLAGRLLKVGMF
jgi:CheY-like chemotaxis protein